MIQKYILGFLCVGNCFQLFAMTEQPAQLTMRKRISQVQRENAEQEERFRLSEASAREFMITDVQEEKQNDKGMNASLIAGSLALFSAGIFCLKTAIVYSESHEMCGWEGTPDLVTPVETMLFVSGAYCAACGVGYFVLGCDRCCCSKTQSHK